MPFGKECASARADISGCGKVTVSLVMDEVGGGHWVVSNAGDVTAVPSSIPDLYYANSFRFIQP
jgi:hypothetical protein